MEKRRFSVFCLLIILTCLIQLFSVNAIGLRSTKLNNEFYFSPNAEATYYYNMVLFNDEPVDAAVYIVDDPTDGTLTNFSKYFTANQYLFENVDKTISPFFSITMNLPRELKEPGTHRVKVGVMEMPEFTGGLSVKTAIESLISVHVPFVGKYLRSSFVVTSVNRGDDIPIEISVTNLGDEKINELYSDVLIYDYNKNTVLSSKTEKISLESKEANSFKLKLSSIGLMPGNYVAEATIYHDNEKDVLAQNFKIGKLELQILNQTSEFVIGKINKFFIEIESDWAEKISGVYADVTLATEPTVKTISKDISGFEKTKLEGFYNVPNLKPGKYKLFISLHYGGETKTKEVEVDVVNDVRKPEFNISSTQALFLVVILIILVANLILFTILVKKKDEHENQSKPPEI